MAQDTIKLGIAGCGGISRMYTGVFAGLAEVAQVVAVADPVDELAEQRRQAISDAYHAQAYSSAVLAVDSRTQEDRGSHRARAQAAESAAATKIRKYRDYEELLSDDEVQVMFLLTPPSLRAGPVIAAAEAGRHVYSEGPMARSVEEADAIVDAVRKAGIKYHSQVRDRYPRGMVLARRAVESGLLGKIGSANVELDWYRPASYYVYGGQTPGGGTMHRNWMGTWEGEGGGAMFHHGRYLVDPFLWVVGSPVVEIFAYSRPAFVDIETDTISQAVARFANGATGIIHCSLISQAAGMKRGERGRIHISGQDASLAIYQEQGTRSDTSFGSTDNPDAIEALEALRADLATVPETVSHLYQARLFLDTIVNDTEPLVPIEVPRHHVEVSRAVYKSAEEHQPVTLPLAKGDPFYSFEGRLTGK